MPEVIRKCDYCHCPCDFYCNLCKSTICDICIAEPHTSDYYIECPECGNKKLT